ncbi:MAG: PorT family protein [Bacteroidales bacterium]|nr:PorT family protein [Bacteroidales bacterium]
MKHLLIIFCFVFVSGIAFSQSVVRIGTMEISVKQNKEQEIIPQNDPPSQGKPKKNHYRYSTTSGFIGISFMALDRGDEYFDIWGGNSYHFTFGGMHRFSFNEIFSLGTSLQFTNYNYRLRNAASDEEFANEVIGFLPDADNIRKQVYRSRNLAASIFTRFYVVPAKYRSNSSGLYFDLGIQGDFAFSKFYKVKPSVNNKKKYRDGYAFNPFNASPFVRVGWKKIAIIGHYRITDIFNNDAISKELPRLSIGIQFM